MISRLLWYSYIILPKYDTFLKNFQDEITYQGGTINDDPVGGLKMKHEKIWLNTKSIIKYFSLDIVTNMAALYWQLMERLMSV